MPNQIDTIPVERIGNLRVIRNAETNSVAPSVVADNGIPAQAGETVLLPMRGGGGGVGGARAFIELSDAPAAYTGEANKYVAVKGDESGLQFVLGAPGSGIVDATNGLNNDDDPTITELGGTLIRDTTIDGDKRLSISLAIGTALADLLLDPAANGSFGLTWEDSGTGHSIGVASESNRPYLRVRVIGNGGNRILTFWDADSGVPSRETVVYDVNESAGNRRAREYVRDNEHSTKFYDADGTTVLSSETLTPTTKTINAPAIVLSNLPTSDPLVSGQLWNDSNTLRVSP